MALRPSTALVRRASSYLLRPPCAGALQPQALLRHASLNARSLATSRWAEARTSSRSLTDELKQVQANHEEHIAVEDRGVIPIEMSLPFPRIKTTSLSTKRVVIEDKARERPVTLVLLAFRSFAQEQIDSWRMPFEKEIGGCDGQIFDLTVNESWGSQAFSGFTQFLMRGKTPVEKHDYVLAFNSKAREPLVDLLPDDNRLFGYALLLDRHARVRFRCAGLATSRSREKFLKAAKDLIEADAQGAV